ncbi:hypothetical protein V6N13_028317 [Hibiscus sabdariffa]
MDFSNCLILYSANFLDFLTRACSVGLPFATYHVESFAFAWSIQAAYNPTTFTFVVYASMQTLQADYPCKRSAKPSSDPHLG